MSTPKRKESGEPQLRVRIESLEKRASATEAGLTFKATIGDIKAIHGDLVDLQARCAALEKVVFNLPQPKIPLWWQFWKR
jgi:hypothetical protein